MQIKVMSTLQAGQLDKSHLAIRLQPARAKLSMLTLVAKCLKCATLSASLLLGGVQVQSLASSVAHPLEWRQVC